MTAAARARREDKQHRRSVTINLRMSETVKNLIDRAAAVLGKSRTDFMLESARRRAEDVLLDQKFFMLDEKNYTAFLELLDQPPKPVEELRKLLATKAPWEQ